MKNKLILAIATFGMSAMLTHAIPVPASGDSILGPTGTGTVGDPLLTLNVHWDVTTDAIKGYTYSYTLFNPLTDTTKPDQFSVSFDATSLNTQILLGTGLINDHSSVTWFFTPLNQGSSITLSFSSTLPPVLGEGGANDHNPPAPWSTSADLGTKLPVPGVPDGGTTVMLLGAALSGLGLIRRKLVA